MWHHYLMREPTEPRTPGTGKIGTAMTVAAWIVVLLIATWYFHGLVERQHNPNTRIQGSERGGVRGITLQRNRQGHYVTNGRINNRPVVFMLDTGATHVSVPARLAAKLALKPGPEVDVMTANGRISVNMTLLERIQIGPIELQNVRASINPYMHNDEILLGMSFLKHLEFTQRGDQLILRQYE